MLGLPAHTEINRPLPKKAIFEKFEVKSSQRERFDADISRLTLVNFLSTSTIPSLQEGESISSIYVVEVLLKRKDFDERNLLLIAKLIPQKLIFALSYENETCPAVFHNKLMVGSWQEDPHLFLSGLTLDTIWDNLVRQIGGLDADINQSLDEQIQEEDVRQKKAKQLEAFEKRLRTEKQTRRRLEIYNEMQKLKHEIYG